MKTLLINGREEELEVTTLDEVIQHFQLKPEHVVAEVDGQIVDRSEWANYELNTGMKLELVHFVGGG
ncbi:sulfur carrier protein ThiS [Bacillus horti]|uniref:Thiamine biosynthesis protein ThiS n=1 Tax=Caldalkalibacillus horti TaxID=77523 RepID=A0ABT9W416_9BACI|nr:sulfur carrier protein ThiS [Bacillus horti]MDQ0167809.1 thiamine biosynthesis protein ThiS [Bacillus horti]